MVLALLGPLATGVKAAEDIKVGGYQFEPFVGGAHAVTPALIERLNKIQSDYHFVFVPIPAQRRYQLMRSGAIDVLMFEMPTWGWADAGISVEVTRPILSGHEVFVARKGSWDASLKPDDRLKRRMALTLGYHYAFADFDADQKFLKSHFDVMFAETQTQGLKYLVAGTVDLAIVSDMFLACSQKRDKALAGKVEIIPPHDQDYHLPLMVRAGAPITAANLGAMLDTLKRSGQLHSFFEHQGLGQFLVY
ncbi:transporter substrate-binding domain-containing protein [Kordiimonas marina]|uniref:transporter substrate-binding domain-containing protein n=1 Tax=Kordiimonas marina TaxID=2872312 RepID=UPI001FF448C2|nr:transporter substrate-binding domain-containing protein [Kordiimonas marina]MCJ9429706.1 transporter substrate-binding domain-containing protein [Kordiimonas marina]